MYLVSQIIFWVPYIGTSLILVTILYFYLFKSLRYKGFLKLSVYLTIAFFLASWLGQIGFLYFSIKNSTFSNELLSGNNSFFLGRVYGISQTFVITLAVAAILFLIGKIIIKFQKKPYLQSDMPVILLIIGLMLNFSNTIPVLILALLLAIIIGLALRVIKRDNGNIIIEPYLFMAAFIIHIAMLLPSYATLLAKMHLI